MELVTKLKSDESLPREGDIVAIDWVDDKSREPYLLVQGLDNKYLLISLEDGTSTATGKYSSIYELMNDLNTASSEIISGFKVYHQEDYALKLIPKNHNIRSGNMSEKNKSTVHRMIGFNIIAVLKNGHAVSGTLIEVDKHGLLIRAEAVSQDEIKELIAVSVAHHNIDYIQSRQDDNKHNKKTMSYGLLFEG